MSRAQHVCIACSSQIQQLYEALMCEECNRWQHLRCGTGISQSFYWKVAKCLGVFEWSCTECWSTAPVFDQHAAPVSNHSAPPVSSRPAGVVYSQSTTPVSVPSTTSVSNRSITPVFSRPVASVSNRSTARFSRRSTARFSRRPAAPVPSRPVASVPGPSSVCQETMVSDPNLLDYVTYELLEDGSSQEDPLVVSSDGYEYTSRGNSNRWECYKVTCRAPVVQTGESFHRGSRNHNHEPQPGNIIRRKVIAKAKAKAVTKISESAESLARQILATVPNATPSVPNLVDLTNFILAKRRSLKFTQAANESALN